MKVQIEKVNKIEPFKPFNCVLNFENENEVKKFLGVLTPKVNEGVVGNVLDLSEPLFQMYDKIRTELQNQGFIEPEIYED